MTEEIIPYVPENRAETVEDPREPLVARVIREHIAATEEIDLEDATEHVSSELSTAAELFKKRTGKAPTFEQAIEELTTNPNSDIDADQFIFLLDEKHSHLKPLTHRQKMFGLARVISHTCTRLSRDIGTELFRHDEKFPNAEKVVKEKAAKLRRLQDLQLKITDIYTNPVQV